MKRFNQNKIRCSKCNHFAVWEYVPNPIEWYYCDECVPRGCSCNNRPITDDWENGPFEQLRDDQGRLLPCCEYEYSDCGFDETDEDPI